MTDSLTTLHYTVNGNIVNGVYAPAAAGFNLADVTSVEELNALPAGVMGLVYLGATDGATAAFKAAVSAFIGNPKLYGFYLVDEPDPAVVSAANLMAESDWIHAHVPGAVTFLVEQNMSSDYHPVFPFTPANTHVDLFGIDPYPVNTNVNGSLDYSIIPTAVNAAVAAGIPLGAIVPVYQAFGGGEYTTFIMPTAQQESRILAAWGAVVPNPAFDYAYSWGTQLGDTAISMSPALQQVFATHNALTVTPPPSSAAAPALRDLNADGRTDVVFRNASGGAYLWSMNGATAVGAALGTQPSANWTIAGVADFNGDGKADLLWTYANAANAGDALNGADYISLQNGASVIGGGMVQQLATSWRVAGVGDFNGDGKADILYRDAATGRTYLDVMNGASVQASSGFTSTQVTDSRWSVTAVADFNGDGKSDVLWRYYNAANAADAMNGALYEWTMNGATATGASALSRQPGANWNVAGTCDFNGDGTADILFRYENAANARDPLNGMAYIDFMNGANVLSSSAPTQWQVDNSWAVASIGDFDGDGKGDILWQQAATGSMYLWDMTGASVVGGAATTAQPGLGWSVQNGA